MSRFQERYGPWALVTGASSGIGAAFARKLAERGVNVALVARRTGKLRELAAALEKDHAIRTRIVPLDLAERNLLPALLTALDGIEVGLLVNNAGFGNPGDFLDQDLDREVAALHVNCRAPLILAHTYGRTLKNRGRGGIIFVSSFFAFSPVPFMANYAATKAYDLFLGEAVAEELRGSGVDMMALCPGVTRTGFFDAAKLDFGRLPAGEQSKSMAPEEVVEAALRKLGRRTNVIPGWRNALIVLIGKFTPRALNIRQAAVKVSRVLKR
jgi:short-subunit dehydrogenase